MVEIPTRANGKKAAGCLVEITIGAIGGCWKVLMIHHLMRETQRFGELARLLNGISARTLTRQLPELETDGIIHRKVYPQFPPKVEYTLTELGRELEPVLQGGLALFWAPRITDDVLGNASS